jgi:hypothetical protein
MVADVLAEQFDGEGMQGLILVRSMTPLGALSSGAEMGPTHHDKREVLARIEPMAQVMGWIPLAPRLWQPACLPGNTANTLTMACFWRI